MNVTNSYTTLCKNLVYGEPTWLALLSKYKNTNETLLPALVCLIVSTANEIALMLHSILTAAGSR